MVFHQGTPIPDEKDTPPGNLDAKTFGPPS